MTTVDTVTARVRQYALKAAVTASKVRIRLAAGGAAVRAAPSLRLRPRRRR